MCQTHGERGPGGQIQGHPRPTLWEHRWELGMTDPPPRVHPAPSSQGPSSPEGSSGRRLFLATSASAPKPRPTARPARRGLRALGICLGTGHVPIAPPPTRPGAAPETQPRFPGSLADTPDTLGRRWGVGGWSAAGDTHLLFSGSGSLQVLAGEKPPRHPHPLHYRLPGHANTPQVNVQLGATLQGGPSRDGTWTRNGLGPRTS